MWTCVRVGEAKNERVRESVNPLDGCTRPLWVCEGGPKHGSWPELCGALLSEGCRRPRRRDGFRLKCSEVQNELAASHGRCQILTEACVFVTRAVWACVVFGADCAGGGYRMLLVGLGLLADACRASITLLTLCLCSSVGGGCMAQLRTLVDEKKKKRITFCWDESRQKYGNNGIREMDEELKGRGKMWGSTRQSANTGTNAYTAAKGLSQGKENNNNYSNKSLNGVVR